MANFFKRNLTFAAYLSLNSVRSEPRIIIGAAQTSALLRKPRMTFFSIKSKPVLVPAFNIFASCLPGLEPFLDQELKALGFANQQSIAGGVCFSVSTVEEIHQCHLHLGTASHIFLRAGPAFRALGMEELARKVSKQRFWREYLKFPLKHLRLSIRVTSSKSRLYHTAGIAQRVERGINIALGKHEDFAEFSSSPATQCDTFIKILVRIHRDQVEISVDTSSTPLHKRGYRAEGAKAPLREDLAFALLYASGFGNGDMVGLLDPFCGSGTIVLEGAAIAYGLPPGRLRQAPLIGSVFEDKIGWETMVDSAVKKARATTESDFANNKPEFIGTDRNKGAIEISQRNAKRAGLSALVSFHHRVISDVDWFANPLLASDKKFVATNPPFGHRIKNTKNKSLLPLYQTLGHKVTKKALQNKVVGVSILAHDPKLIRQTGIPNLKLLFHSKHGGMNIFVLGTKRTSK
jgi:putative N6-adenine-specific DNA methylase